jgi:CRP/FNR family transcriptional regulator, anaerobic regulatory protein
MAWTDHAALGDLPDRARRLLDSVHPVDIPAGTVLFRPGEAAQGFVVVLSGRIDVFLTGPNGREILLYSVAPGQSCIQTTLGLLGEEDYAGEAVAATPCHVAMIPKGMFLSLMDDGPGFRGFVFAAFATRMQNMMHLIEMVAFQKIECRLASALLDLEVGGIIHATQAVLAARIGSAREVVSRRLDNFARQGWVETDRGQVLIRNHDRLRQLAAMDNAD